ncbi:unnamed protein product [Amoebophrya sp. A120]|nr:unnamed protein product [Amoebophrya sp. A120]|eukprot:GSA120T00016320001.1
MQEDDTTPSCARGETGRQEDPSGSKDDVALNVYDFWSTLPAAASIMQGNYGVFFSETLSSSSSAHRLGARGAEPPPRRKNASGSRSTCWPSYFPSTSREQYRKQIFFFGEKYCKSRRTRGGGRRRVVDLFPPRRRTDDLLHHQHPRIKASLVVEVVPPSDRQPGRRVGADHFRSKTFLPPRPAKSTKRRATGTNVKMSLCSLMCYYLFSTQLLAVLAVVCSWVLAQFGGLVLQSEVAGPVGTTTTTLPSSTTSCGQELQMKTSSRSIFPRQSSRCKLYYKSTTSVVSEPPSTSPSRESSLFVSAFSPTTLTQSARRNEQSARRKDKKGSRTRSTEVDRSKLSSSSSAANKVMKRTSRAAAGAEAQAGEKVKTKKHRGHTTTSSTTSLSKKKMRRKSTTKQKVKIGAEQQEQRGGQQQEHAKSSKTAASSSAGRSVVSATSTAVSAMNKARIHAAEEGEGQEQQEQQEGKSTSEIKKEESAASRTSAGTSAGGGARRLQFRVEKTAAKRRQAAEEACKMDYFCGERRDEDWLKASFSEKLRKSSADLAQAEWRASEDERKLKDEEAQDRKAQEEGSKEKTRQEESTALALKSRVQMLVSEDEKKMLETVGQRKAELQAATERATAIRQWSDHVTLVSKMKESKKEIAVFKAKLFAHHKRQKRLPLSGTATQSSTLPMQKGSGTYYIDASFGAAKGIDEKTQMAKPETDVEELQPGYFSTEYPYLDGALFSGSPFSQTSMPRAWWQLELQSFPMIVVEVILVTLSPKACGVASLFTWTDLSECRSAAGGEKSETIATDPLEDLADVDVPDQLDDAYLVVGVKTDVDFDAPGKGGGPCQAFAAGGWKANACGLPHPQDIRDDESTRTTFRSEFLQDTNVGEWDNQTTWNNNELPTMKGKYSVCGSKRAEGYSMPGLDIKNQDHLVTWAKQDEEKREAEAKDEVYDEPYEKLLETRNPDEANGGDEYYRIRVDCYAALGKYVFIELPHGKTERQVVRENQDTLVNPERIDLMSSSGSVNKSSTVSYFGATNVDLPRVLQLREVVVYGSIYDVATNATREQMMADKFQNYTDQFDEVFQTVNEDNTVAPPGLSAGGGGGGTTLLRTDMSLTTSTSRTGGRANKSNLRAGETTQVSAAPAASNGSVMYLWDPNALTPTPPENSTGVYNQVGSACTSEEVDLDAEGCGLTGLAELHVLETSVRAISRSDVATDYLSTHKPIHAFDRNKGGFPHPINHKYATLFEGIPTENPWLYAEFTHVAFVEYIDVYPHPGPVCVGRARSVYVPN